VAFDPYLYVALGAGVLAGQLSRVRSPWAGRATRATVLVLVGLLGTLLDTVPAGSLLLVLPISLGFAVLILALTGGLFLLLRRAAPAQAAGEGGLDRHEMVPFSAMLIAALVGGFLIGRVVVLPSSTGITWALYALLALVGFDLRLTWVRARDLAVPLTAATGGAVAAALVFVLAAGAGWAVAFGTTLAFGWYTLAGPLVAARAGALLGLLAFLTNFFRENLTMVLSPYVGRRLRGGGLAALGGATSMDTTLYFVTRFGDEDAGSLALAVGLVFTLAAGVLLPLILAAPL
jgi:uncharacterized membrane protein YbjE (DUF340 family)